MLRALLHNRCFEDHNINAAALGNPQIAHHASLVSTNDEAMRLAFAGHAGPIWVQADAQTGGRGRRGRVWIAPPGNLNVSLLLIDPVPLAIMPQLGFVAGVALALVLREILGGEPLLQVKWPNDMVFSGAKVAGLMLETSVLPGGNVACIIGFGVNCRAHPLDLPYPVTDLSTITHRPIDAGDVLARLVPAMHQELAHHARGENFVLIRERWLALASGLGTTALVDTGTTRLEGVFETIDASGRMVLDVEGRRTLVEAGDVFLSAEPRGTWHE